MSLFIQFHTTWGVKLLIYSIKKPYHFSKTLFIFNLKYFLIYFMKDGVLDCSKRRRSWRKRERGGREGGRETERCILPFGGNWELLPLWTPWRCCFELYGSTFLCSAIYAVQSMWRRAIIGLNNFKV